MNSRGAFAFPKHCHEFRGEPALSFTLLSLVYCWETLWPGAALSIFHSDQLLAVCLTGVEVELGG